ncbi:hypothetical protein KRR39_17195 [Nocardioides panacis]|uniref:Uncharacterized protein n=1 Tax=Nocardioides panacis TaxID=2849501 RepID=A0A975SWI2_9ACTN|nr:hypothetical protein [Nocardioides panacis]QWZ07198.1 hypothetical protein KRR39_17195 [Nocardioides panacis]
MVRLPDQLTGLGTLGPAEPTGDLLGTVVRAALRDDSAAVLDAAAVATGYPFTSIGTGGLFRVTGTASTTAGERPWSAFVKVLQHPRHWPLIDALPPRAAAEILAFFPWREELDTHERVLPALPAGLRVPEVYAAADLGDDRLAWWMEDVDADDDAWTDEGYARAAHLLARLAARRRAGTAAGASHLPAGYGVRKVLDARGPLLAGALADDALWERPVVTGTVDPAYRADLARALAAMPALLEEMDTLPLALPHGDAAPVNLLRPRAEPTTLVAVDFAFQCPLPLGHDLGQLLAGEVERGRMEPARLPALLRVVERAYVDGLAAEGLDVAAGTVRRGLVCSSLGPRTLPGAFPVEHLDGPDTEEHRAFLRRRAGLGRFALDLVLSPADA